MFELLLQQAQEKASNQNLGDFSNPKLVIDPITGTGYLESSGENPAKIDFQVDLSSGVVDFEPKAQTENEPTEEVKEEETDPNAENEETPEEKSLEETLKSTEDMATDEPAEPPLEEKKKSEDLAPADPVSEPIAEEEPKPKVVLKPLGSKQKSYVPDLCNLYNVYFPNSIQ